MTNYNKIDRRDALKTLGMLTGYAITAGAASAFLAGCKADQKPIKGKNASSLFNEEQMKTIAEIAERMLPKTDTPGAKEAGVDQYISMALTNYYKAEDQKIFLDKFQTFDKIAIDKYKKKFVELNDQNKDDVLKIMAEEWKKNEKNDHIFKEFRDLVVTGYCTSEVGAKQLLKYDPIPGPYKGCIDRSEVGGVWALG